MHHTGIKTSRKDKLSSRIKDFNCTIQELKPVYVIGLERKRFNFNCTIQELKPFLDKGGIAKKKKFQLHHTGIKTFLSTYGNSLSIEFQLHHTGIKTKALARYTSDKPDFNCTIQELKPDPLQHANNLILFQLHHTGIKT